MTLHKELIYQWTEAPQRSLEDNVGDDYEAVVEMLRDDLGFIEENPQKFSKWSLTPAGVAHISESVGP